MSHENAGTGHTGIVSWNLNKINLETKTKIAHYVGQHKHIFCLQELQKTYESQFDNYSYSINNYISFSMPHGFGKSILLIHDCMSPESVDITFQWNSDKYNAAIQLPPNSDERKKLLMSRLYVASARVKNWAVGKHFIFISYYRPQNHGGSEPQRLFEYINLVKIKYPNDIIFIAGDFNAHSALWMEDGPYSAAKPGKIFQNYFDTNSWIVLNDGTPTRIRQTVANLEQTAPDVVCCDTDIDFRFEVDRIPITATGQASDHMPICITLFNSSFIEDVPDKFKVRNGTDLDWDLYRKNLSEKIINWKIGYEQKFSEILKSRLRGSSIKAARENLNIEHDFLEQGVCDFMDCISSAAIESFGFRKIKAIHTEQWMTLEAKNAIDEYDMIMRADEQLPDNIKQRDSWKHSIAEAKKKMDDACNHSQLNFCEAVLKDNETWENVNFIIKSNSKERKSIPPLFNKLGELIAETSQQKAEEYIKFHHRFDDAFIRQRDGEQKEEEEFIENDEYEELINDHKQRYHYGNKERVKALLKELNAPISKKEIEFVVKSFDPTKSVGEDYISHRQVQEGLEILLDCLHLVLNVMFKMNVRPQVLSERLIKILKKYGKLAKFIESYRPISILSNFAQIYDKIMARRILEFAIKAGFIHENMYGSIANMSSLDCLLDFINGLEENIKNKIFTHLLYIDWHSAYDTVWHSKLIDCLVNDYCFEGEILDYIKTALSNRKGRCEVNHCTTDWVPDVLGLPQGWPPSPILFVLFCGIFTLINNLPDIPISLKTFVDDNLVQNHADVEADDMQKALNLIEYMARKKSLIMRAEKQEYMVVSYRKKMKKADHKEEYFDLKMGDEPIKKVYTSVKYLGVFIDWNLSFDKQCSHIVNRVRYSFLLLKNRLHHVSTVRMFWIVMVYTAYVLGKMQYAIAIWYRKSAKSASRLRTLYNDMLRLFCGDRASIPLEIMYFLTGFPSFEEYILLQRSNLWE